MEIVYDDDALREAMAELSGFGSLGKEGGLSAERPVLVDRFLEDATEVDVDAIRDHTGEVVIGAVMEHVEEAGVHSGDSRLRHPAATRCRPRPIAVIEGYTRAIAEALDVRGLVNVQYAVKQGQVFVIEANPRASRTVPVRGQGHRRAAGEGGGPGDARRHARRAARRGPAARRRSPAATVAVKEAVLPFNRFPDADSVLGPEMRSTGEVMGIDRTFGLAFAKSQLAAGDRLPDRRHRVHLASPTATRTVALRAARLFVEQGFQLAATAGTADHLEANGVPVVTRVAKVGEEHAEAVDAVQLLDSGKVDLVVNSPRGRGARADGAHIRRAAVGQRRALPHHRRRRPGRRRGHRRPGAPRPPGPDPAGVPPDGGGLIAARAAPARAGRSLRVTAPSVAGRPGDAGRPAAAVPTARSTVGAVAPSRTDPGRRRRRAAMTSTLDASGRCSCRARSSPRRGPPGTGPSWPPTATSAALGAVTVKSPARRPVAGQPGAPGAPRRRRGRHAQQRRPAGPGRGGLAARRPAGHAGGRRPGGGVDLGPVGRRLRRGRRARSPAPRSWPSRSTCRAPTSTAAATCSPSPPPTPPTVIEQVVAAVAPIPVWAKLTAVTDSIVEIAGAVATPGPTPSR